MYMCVTTNVLCYKQKQLAKKKYIQEFILMTILAKTIFASPVFTMEKTVFSTIWQKPANPGRNLVSQCSIKTGGTTSSK